MTEALAGFRIVEVGSFEAAAYAGKLFSDFGAQVTKVEPPEGDPMRRVPPLVDIGDGRQESAFAAWLNTGKGSLVADGLDDPIVDEALRSAHLVIDGGPPAGAAARRERWRIANPSLSVLAMSWFGETGPYAGFQGSDAIVRCLAGVVKLTGDREGPPLMLNDHQASIFCGLTAYSAGIAALYSETPRTFEVTAMESSVVMSEFQFMLRFAAPEERGRQGVNKFFPTYPLGTYRCKEGWLGVTVGTPPQWAAFCDMLGIGHIAEDERLKTRFGRSRHMHEIEGLISERLLGRTAAEWFGIALEKRLPLVVVPDMAELLKQKVHRDREAFSRVTIGGSSFEAPTVPLHLKGTLPRRDASAPLVGEHGGRTAVSAPAPVGDREKAPVGKRPLAGMRILDLAMGWAGPLVTRQLSDLGAEILKIEACPYPDWWRNYDGPELPKTEHSPYFIALNRNKTDAAIDIYSDRGREAIRRLVPLVDAVVENYAANVMPKLGMGYEDVRRLNPSIVMLSMPGYTGEWSRMRAYGSTLEHGSGLPSVTGPAGGPPVLNHLAYGDPVGGLNGAAALLTALLHRRRTGEGQHIELSQIQALLPLAAPWIIEQSLTGKVARLGNRHPMFVPHNIFPTADDDGWLAVAVTSDAAWKTLAALIGRGDLAEGTLGTAAGRREREDELERAISSWTRRFDADRLMSELQSAGIAAGVVRSPAELDREPHLVARGDWEIVPRRFSGAQPQFASPFRENGTAYPVISAAPVLGEHNGRVLEDILGLTPQEVADLEACGAVGSA